MKKTISTLLLGVVSLLLLLLLSASVYAQTDPAPESAAGTQWYCLKAANKEGDGHGSNLSSHPAVDGKGRPLDVVDGQVSKAYVFVKIKGYYSTGSRATDVEAMGEQFASENYDPLEAACGFTSAGLKNTTNPANVTGGGEMDPTPLYWHDDLSCGGQAHMWYGMQKVTATGGGNEVGNDSGLKNGNFAFSTEGMNSNCSVLNWDPMGYIFDATTHGPVSGVSIRILRKDPTSGTFVVVPKGIGTGLVASNPVITDVDGSYEFYSSSGDYKYEIVAPHVIATTVIPGYETFGYEAPYVANESFYEKEGDIVRKDIAINTVNAPAPSAYSELSQPLLKLNKLNKQPGTVNGEAGWSISGRVNIMPSDFVVTYSSLDGAKKKEEIYHLIHGHQYKNPATDVVRSKDEHYFVISVPQIIKGDAEGEQLFYVNPPTIRKYVSATAQKKSNTILATFINYIVRKLGEFIPVSRAAEVVGIDVSPTYLEGIALNNQGKIVPFAKVGVYVKGSKTVAFQTKADAQGHYIVESRWIPPLPYEIRITSVTGESIKISPVEYLKQNQEYHKTNEIDSFTVRNTNTSLNASLQAGVEGTNPIPPKSTPIPAQQLNPDGTVKSSSNNTNQNGPRSSGSTPASGIMTAITGNGSQGVVMVVIVLLVLVLVGVGAFVMMKSKQQPSQQ